jgi:hypothetical protein
VPRRSDLGATRDDRANGLETQYAARGVLGPAAPRHVHADAVRRAQQPHDVVLDRPERTLRQRRDRIAADRAQPEVEREHRRHRGEHELKHQARAHRYPSLRPRRTPTWYQRRRTAPGLR